MAPGPLAVRAQKERWAQWSLRGGVQSLPEALGRSLEQSDTVELHTEAQVTGLELGASGWTVRPFKHHTLH